MSNQPFEFLPAYVSPPPSALVLGKRSRPAVNSRPTSKSHSYCCRSSFLHPTTFPFTITCSSDREENSFDASDKSNAPSNRLKTRHEPGGQAFGPDAKKRNDFHHSGERAGDQDSSSRSVADSGSPSFRSVKYPQNFRWPFYQGTSDSQTNSNTHVAKRTKPEKPDNKTDRSTHHSDLGSGSKPSTKNMFPFPEQTRSIQQRWKQVVDKMLPPRSTTKEGSIAHGNRKHQQLPTDVHLSENNNEQSSKSAVKPESSVRDLYQPPPSPQKPESPRKKPSWFNSPWSRSSDNRSSDDNPDRVNDDVSRRGYGDTKGETSSPDRSQESATSNSSKGHRWSFPLWKMSKNVHDSGVSGKSDPGRDADKPEESQREVSSHLSDATHLHRSKTGICDDEEDTPQSVTTGEDETTSSVHQNLDEEARHTDCDNETSFRSPNSDNGADDDSKSERTASSIHADQSRDSVSGSRNDSDIIFSQRDIANIRLIFGSETFFATEAMSAPGGLIFRGNLRGEPVVALKKLEDRLKGRFGSKYTICLAEGDEDRRPVVVVVPSTHYMRSLSPRQRLIAIGIAAMTATTCLSRGISANMLRQRIFSAYGLPPLNNLMDKLFFRPLSSSITIACAVAIVIMISQAVQRIVASFHRTRIALPFVLPSYQLGSFGAIVHIASPAPSRTALFDIAAAGSATLLIISLVCLLIGLRLSTTFTAVFPVPMSMVSGSILMGFLTKNVPNGKILVDYGQSLIGLHPLAIIGANCLTITALNLLPIRLLDGGRIMAALYGRKVGLVVSRMAVLFLLLASSRTPYLVMFLLAVSFGPWYVDRPSKNELTEPDNVRTIIGYLLMLTMLGILLPYPKSAFFGTLAP